MQIGEEPIRRKNKFYPKDFTPGSIITKKKEEEHSTSRYQYNQSQVEDDPNHQPFTHQIAIQTFTEKTSSPHHHQDHLFLQNKPLVKQFHKTPKIQIPKPKPQFQIYDKVIEEQSQHDDEASPGTIRKQISPTIQNTLLQEPKITIQVESVQKITQNKINSASQRLFEAIRKPNINQPKKSPVLGRGDYSDTGSFRLVQKQSTDFMIRTHQKFLDPTPRNLQPISQKTPYLDSQRVKMINQQIVQIMEKRKAKLSPPKQTQQQQSNQNPQRSRSSSFQASKITHKFYPELQTQTKRKHYDSERQFSFSEHRQLKKVQITYKTSLSQMKDLVNLKDSISLSLNISIPECLKHPLINSRHSRVQVFEIGCQLFRQLGLPFDNLTVKKYSNCILMVNRNICILWHYDGRFYLGGWQVQYLDEGFRHGIGLEWVPNKYIYYGEYATNKRQGLGIMKKNGEVYVGLWNKGFKCGYGRTYMANGEIIQKNQDNESQSQSSGEYKNDQLNRYEPSFD